MDTVSAPDPRRLDAALAQHLFGWTKDAQGHWVPPRRDGEQEAAPEGMLVMPPNYSRFSDGMLAVLEAMAVRGWQATLHVAPRWTGCTFIKLEETAMRRGSIDLDAEADSLPLAVALACLRALGVEVDGG